MSVRKTREQVKHCKMCGAQLSIKASKTCPPPKDCKTRFNTMMKIAWEKVRKETWGVGRVRQQTSIWNQLDVVDETVKEVESRPLPGLYCRGMEQKRQQEADAQLMFEDLRAWG